MNSASSAAALVFDLTLCTHTYTEGKPRERPESGIYFKILEKTQYLMNTLYVPCVFFCLLLAYFLFFKNMLS